MAAKKKKAKGGFGGKKAAQFKKGHGKKKNPKPKPF